MAHGLQGRQDVREAGDLGARGRLGGEGFRVWGLGFRVWGLGFRVWGLGFIGFGA